MSYKIRQESSQQILVHGKWVDIPGTGYVGEQEVSGCHISQMLSGAVTTPEQFDQLIRNCMGLDDDPEHAQFIRKLAVKVSPPDEAEGQKLLEWKVGDRVFAIKDRGGHFQRGQKATVTGLEGDSYHPVILRIQVDDRDGECRGLPSDFDLVGRVDPDTASEQPEQPKAETQQETVQTADPQPEWREPTSAEELTEGTRVKVRDGVDQPYFVSGNEGTVINGKDGNGAWVAFDAPYHDGDGMWYVSVNEVLVNKERPWRNLRRGEASRLEVGQEVRCNEDHLWANEGDEGVVVTPSPGNGGHSPQIRWNEGSKHGGQGLTLYVQARYLQVRS